MGKKAVRRGGARSMAVPTACLCGMTHPSRTEARECRRWSVALLDAYWRRRWGFSLDDLLHSETPRLPSVPQKVLRAVRTVCQWVEDEGGRRKEGKPSRPPPKPSGPRHGWWRFRRRLHLCETDSRGTKTLGKPVCGSGESLYDNRQCPKCVRWLRKSDAPTAGSLVEREGGPGSDFQRAVRLQVVKELRVLSARERDILMMRFGFKEGGSRTLVEIGQAFKISRERVRQIEKAALRKFRAACPEWFSAFLMRAGDCLSELECLECGVRFEVSLAAPKAKAP